MSEVDLIVGALAAGAAAGTTATASGAVQDAYQALKELLRSRFTGRPEAQGKLYADKTTGDGWQELIGADLVESGAVGDPEVLAAARKVRQVAPGAVGVHIEGDVRGGQFGNNNDQKNYFTS